MKAILIDAAAREIREVEVPTYSEINRLIGCSCLCVAWQFANRDVLLVDDEGLLKPTQDFFWLAAREDQPLAGNGLLMGPDDPDGDTSLPPKTTLAQIASMIRFVDRAGAVSWAQAHPHALATVISSFGEHGVVVSRDVIPLIPTAFPEAV